MFQTRPQIADELENAPKAGGPGRGENYPPRAPASRASASKLAEATDLDVRDDRGSALNLGHDVFTSTACKFLPSVSAV